MLTKPWDGFDVLCLFWLVSFVVALASNGPRSIGAGLVCLAMTVVLEGMEWRKHK